jgi:hypothetical protein
MKMRTMLGLAAIGGALYVHKRRGGEFTVDSIKRSLNELWSAVTAKAAEVSDAIERDTAHQPQARGGDHPFARP